MGIVHVLKIIWVSGVVTREWESGMGIVHVLIIIWASVISKGSGRSVWASCIY